MTEFLSTHEPATGALITELPIGDAAREVAIARAASIGWAMTPLAERIATLQRFAGIVRERAEAFATLIARETGKPLWEAKTEVDTVVAKVAISITAQAERAGERVTDQPGGGCMALRHRPHGVLAVLGPYNFPAHLPNGHIVPALLAGNAVVFKPSEKTPATAAFLVDCYHAAGVPEGAVRLLIGRPDGDVHWRGMTISTGCSSPDRRGPASRSTASSPSGPKRSRRWRWAATTRLSSGTIPIWTPPPR